MKINWKVRVKNPVFWISVVLAIVCPILAYFGMNWTDLTTWEMVGNIFLSAVQNPVVVVSVIISLWNTIIDPTTAGLSDSSQALSYIMPKRSEE